jgi:hypothetical protein
MMQVGGSNWAPGKEYLVYSMNATCGSVGAGYSADIEVTYTSEAGITHVEQGTIRGKCE